MARRRRRAPRGGSEQRGQRRRFWRCERRPAASSAQRRRTSGARRAGVARAVDRGGRWWRRAAPLRGLALPTAERWRRRRPRSGPPREQVAAEGPPPTPKVGPSRSRRRHRTAADHLIAPTSPSAPIRIRLRTVCRHLSPLVGSARGGGRRPRRTAVGGMTETELRREMWDRGELHDSVGVGAPRALASPRLRPSPLRPTPSLRQGAGGAKQAAAGQAIRRPQARAARSRAMSAGFRGWRRPTR